MEDHAGSPRVASFRAASHRFLSARGLQATHGSSALGIRMSTSHSGSQSTRSVTEAISRHHRTSVSGDLGASPYRVAPRSHRTSSHARYPRQEEGVPRVRRCRPVGGQGVRRACAPALSSVLPMSRYPGNPWWHHQLDIPITIMSRSEWDEAAAAGHVTPEHVMRRLKNIADHAFDNQTVMGFDEDGFVVSLIAEGLALAGGVTLRVYPNDHPPPHVHIEVRSRPNARIRINLATGEFLDDAPRGLPRKKLKGFQAAVRENHEVLATWWESYHGEPVVLA